MSDSPMKEFHRLVAQQEFRDAQGILETSEEIEPEVAEKWQGWLDALYREQRLQVGVPSDKKKQDPQRALHHLLETSAGMAVIVLASIPLWLLVKTVLTYETFDYLLSGVFLLVSLPTSYFGWQFAARLIAPRYTTWLGMAINFGLLVFLLTSGFPFFYFYDVPLHYLLAAFALLAPAAAYISYRTGAGLMRRLLRIIDRRDDLL